jgi:hypothetical protein
MVNQDLLKTPDELEKELIKLLEGFNYIYDKPSDISMIRKIYVLYKYNKIDYFCKDSDYLTYLAWYYGAVKSNFILQRKYYKKAIKRGNVHAMYNLASNYNVSQKYNKKIKYLKMAIELNDSESMNCLGYHYLYIDNDVGLAKKYFNMAIKNNYFNGYLELAYYYYENKFNYKKCKQNIMLFLDSHENEKQIYLHKFHMKKRDTALITLLSIIFKYEKEDNLDFLIPYCQKFLKLNNYNTSEAILNIEIYNSKMNLRKQFITNKEKYAIIGDCVVCYENKKLILFDCIGHYICHKCYDHPFLLKCPFCLIAKHPLMIKKVHPTELNEEQTQQQIEEIETEEIEAAEEIYDSYDESSDEGENSSDEEDELVIHDSNIVILLPNL